jgi:hypothetical protein
MMRGSRIPLWCCVALAPLLGPAGAIAQDVQFVAGSTTPLVQLSGEHFQISVDGGYYAEPTPAATLSRYGVLGTDLGHPLVYPDRIVFLFGDTVGAYKSGDRFLQSHGNPSGVGDSIGYIPNSDFSQCRYIADIAEQLAKGIKAPAADRSTCPVIRFYTNPVRGVDEHVFKPLVISGLAPDESQATFRVPTSALTFRDRVYVFHTTRVQDAMPVAAFYLQSVLARSDQSPDVWSDTTPPSFTKLHVVSSHPDVADPANPPPVAGGGGKFIYIKSVVMDGAAIADAGLTQMLPPALQTAPEVVFVFGASWRSRQSDMYLAAFALRDIEAGPSSWSYYVGSNRWSNREADAVELLGTDDVDQHSVTWNTMLRRFVLMRSTRGIVVAQFAAAPWGPWSTPQPVLSSADAWGTRLLHRPGRDQIVQSLVPVYNRNGSQVPFPDSEPGVFYSPTVIEKPTQHPDGSVTLYFTVSTWNPYQVFLMSSTFRRGPVAPPAPPVRPTPPRP